MRTIGGGFLGLEAWIIPEALWTKGAPPYVVGVRFSVKEIAAEAGKP